MFVLREDKLDAEASWISGIVVWRGRVEFESIDGDGEEGGEEECRVGGLDVLIDIWGCLFENEGPELGDLVDDCGATGVDWGC